MKSLKEDEPVAREISSTAERERELQLAIALLRSQQETVPDGILVVDSRQRVLSWNKRFAEMWKIPPEVMSTKSDRALIASVLPGLLHPEEFRKKVEYLYHHPELQSQDEIELKDGRIFDRFSAPLSGPTGENYGRIWFFRDITDQKVSERTIRQYAQRMEMLHEMDQAILLARSPEQIAEAAIEKLQRLVPCEGICVVQFDPSQLQSRKLAVRTTAGTPPCLASLLPFQCKEYLEFRENNAALVLAGNDPWFRTGRFDAVENPGKESSRNFLSIPLLAQDNLIGVLNLFDSPKGSFDGDDLEISREVAALLALAIQDAQLIRALKEQENELRSLTLRLAEVEESERKHLAHELHDEVGQSLTALGVNLEILRNDPLLAGSDAIRKRIDLSVNLVEKMTDQIRTVMTELSPPLLDDYGLLSSVRWLGEKISKLTGVRIEYAGITGNLPRLGSLKEITLYRIVQEALTNAAKHAEAGAITISFEVQGGNICLEIIDDGKGFDLKKRKMTRESKGWGLLIMKERIQSLGGRFWIESRMSEGTRIRVEVQK